MTAGGLGLDRTVARANALGIKVVSGNLTAPFRCVAPGHDHSARLHHHRGFWQYRCQQVGRLLELGEVRAALGYGDTRQISELERVRWRELLDYEAGILDRGPHPIPLPPDASPSTLRVGEAWRLHVGLRDPEVWPPGEPYVFARAYVMARASVTDAEARRGVRELRAHGSMRPVGIDFRTRATLWVPGPTYYIQFGNPDVAVEHTIQVLMETFEAVEVSGTTSEAEEEQR